MTPVRVRDLNDSDLAQVAALNAGAVPAVNDLTDGHLRDVIALCDLAIVGVDERDRVVAFLLSLAPGQPYASQNYQWFESREQSHQYIDRVVVAPQAHGTGVGRALYEHVFARARERGVDQVTCEVNTDPPNPQSLAFHERLGFKRLSEQTTRGGEVTVAMLARPATGP